MDEEKKTILQQETFTKVNLTPVKARIMLLLLLVVYGLNGIIYSLQAPFYPKEAKLKNLTATEYGAVFGIFAVTAFLFAIPAGRIASLAGSKLFTMTGVLLLGLSSIAFGFLTYIEDELFFFLMSLLIKILGGFSDIATEVGITTIGITVFHTYSGQFVAWAENLFGLGVIVGPAIGGVLYDIGGFLLPFVVIGSIALASFPFMLFIVPSDKILKEVNVSDNNIAWSILLMPQIWFGTCATCVSLMTTGFLETYLEAHLEVFKLNGTYTGLVFLFYGIGYAGSCPLWGRACDKGFNPTISIVVGNVLQAIGLILVGPAPFLPLSRSLFLILPGIILIGIGQGACVPPSFVYNKNACLKYGYSDNIATNGMLSGMLFSSIFFGLFVGATLGGVLYDYIGFSWSSMIFTVVNIIMAFVSLLIFVIDSYRGLKKGDDLL